MKEEILTNARIVVKELTSEPDALPLVSACAVAGNGWQENLMRPLTIGPKDHGSDGLLQWRLDRLEALQQWPNWTDLRVQCRFFKAECKAMYPGLWKQLQAGDRSIENLTANICDIYERPSRAGRAIDSRIAYAKEVQGLFEPKIPPIAKDLAANPWKTSAALASIIYSAILGMWHNPNWLVWIAIGAIFVLLMKRHKQPEVVLPQIKEPDMNPASVIKILEALIPVIEGIVNELPTIKQEIANLRSDIVARTDPAADQRVVELIDKLNRLGDVR